MSNHTTELYQRMLLEDRYNLEHIADKNLLIVARSPIAQILSLFGLCIGLTKQTIMTPQLDEAFTISNISQEHDPEAEIQETTPKLYFLNQTISQADTEQTVVLIDVGDPEFSSYSPPKNATVISFTANDKYLAFGTNSAQVRAQTTGKAVPARAELIILAGELFNTICAELKVYADAKTKAGLTCGTELGLIPLTDLPKNAKIKPLRLYMAGMGGTISHQFIWSASFDPWWQQILGPKSVIIGADPDQVEPSNRSRQIGYDCSSENKAKAAATTTWIKKLFPHAQVTGLQSVIDSKHFRNQPYDACLSSLDSWSARLELAKICGQHQIPLWLSAGSSFFGGFARLITPSTACPYRHGIEKLAFRKDRVRQSCADPNTPEPSSIIPQAILGGLLAVTLRDHWLGLATQIDPRGYSVNLLEISNAKTFKGLRYTAGLGINSSCSCPGLTQPHI